jgi:hypothetical protein
MLDKWYYTSKQHLHSNTPMHTTEGRCNETGNAYINVILNRVRVTIVAVEKQ